MPRYIDADEFEKRIKPYDTDDQVDKALYNFAHNKMMDTPTADVVEVVRCKDCKYWRDTDHTCRFWGGASPRLACDYCSHGERSEECQS